MVPCSAASLLTMTSREPDDRERPTGVVEYIHIAAAAGEPMVALSRATAIPGSGLDGDRYTTKRGHWSPIARRGDGLTLIEGEVVDSLAGDGLTVNSGDTRRNITVRGIRLDDLIGRRFRIGSAVVQGVRRCEPCQYLEGLLGQQVLHPLVHRGGLRANVLEGGQIAVGDEVAPLDSSVSRPRGA